MPPLISPLMPVPQLLLLVLLLLIGFRLIWLLYRYHSGLSWALEGLPNKKELAWIAGVRFFIGQILSLNELR